MNPETRVAIIGIIVENPEQVDALNQLLHEFNTLTGKIGRLAGISAKTAYSNIKTKADSE